MDEYLFISMAKLGADRVKEERQMRAAPVAAVHPAKVAPVTKRPAATDIEVPTLGARRLASFALAFALALTALGIGGGIAASLESVPSGEVVVIALDANGNAADGVKVAQNDAAVKLAR